MRLVLTRRHPLRFLARQLADPATYATGPLGLVRAWRLGLSTAQVVYHQLVPTTYGDVFPDRDRYLLTIGTNRYVWPILHDKLLFDAFMRGRLPITRAFGAFVEGRCLALEPGFSLTGLEKRLRAGEAFVVKPVQGGKGMGVARLSISDGALYYGTQRLDPSELGRLATGWTYHLIVPYERQHASLEALFPDSINTLRITVLAPPGEAARPIGPVLRIGTRRSAPLDNFSKGGLLASVDPVSGELVDTRARGPNGRAYRVTQHPDSGAELLGVKVPFWTDIRDRLAAFHAEHPGFDFVGWDVLVGPDAWFVVEGNHNPDLDLPFSFVSRRTEPALDAFLRGLYRRT